MNYHQVSDLLLQQDHILILTHRRPDGDTIGCAAALCLALRQLGKTAYVHPNEEAHGLFTPYLKDVLAPTAFIPQYLVAVDIASEGLFPPSATVFQGKVDLCIDHHGSNERYAKVSCVKPQCAACGELLYEIIKLWDQMTPPIALLLYMAIATDTGCFVYSNTSPDTHRITAALMEMEFDRDWVNKRHFRTKSLKRLHLESRIVQEMELFEHGTIAFACITMETMASLQATEEDAEDIASFVGQLEGVEHAVTLRELQPGECKLSLRTGKDLDASAVCALLGGGGHPAAAGCTVFGSVKQAKSAMLDAIRQVSHG